MLPKVMVPHFTKPGEVPRKLMQARWAAGQQSGTTPHMRTRHAGPSPSSAMARPDPLS